MKELKKYIISFTVIFIFMLLPETCVHAEGGDTLLKAADVKVNT